jgi:hypothetical protein
VERWYFFTLSSQCPDFGTINADLTVTTSTERPAGIRKPSAISISRQIAVSLTPSVVRITSRDQNEEMQFVAIAHDEVEFLIRGVDLDADGEKTPLPVTVSAAATSINKLAARLPEEWLFSVPQDTKLKLIVRTSHPECAQIDVPIAIVDGP